jgi:ABC-type transport system involved in multi-copper enzyme maturation permease subunit
MLLHAFITLGVCLIFFDYQSTPFTSADFWYFVESLGFALLTIVFVSALLSMLCATMKNVGLAIVMYVAISFAMVMIVSIMQVAITVLTTMGDNELLLNTLRFIDRLNVGNSVTYIGGGTEYTVKDVLYLTLPPIALTFLLVGMGTLRFNKRDLK